MRLFCTEDHPSCEHKWTVVSARFLPPARGQWSVKGFIDEFDVERMMSGLTVLTQKCERCDYVDTTRHLGRIDVPGFTWERTA